MPRLISSVSGAAVAAVLLLATPVLAEGKADRARSAIAAASAKIDAANKVGATGEVPALQARAQASLRAAKEDLASGNKERAIEEANHATELADMAIGVAQKNKEEASRAQTMDAQQAAMSAQQDAAAANARADSAQQAASAAAADAANARAVPPPAPTTTVTTETVKQAPAPARTTTHRVVKRKVTTPARPAVEKTTTTVTTQPN